MKKSLLILLAIIISYSVHAQIENVQFGDSLKFEKIYVGFNSKMSIPIDSLVVTPSTSVRFGTALNLQLTNSISVYSHGALQFSSDQNSFAIFAFALNFKLLKGLKLAVGLPPTATTFTRAHPFTWKNQSESYTQSRIPGNKPGALLQYSINNKLSLAYSIQNLDGKTWSNHINVTYGKLSVAGFIQNNRETFLSMRYNSEKIDFNYNYSSTNREHASSIFYNFNKIYSLYGDTNFLSHDLDSDVTTLGIRRYFEKKKYHTGGFLAVAYDFPNKQTVFQLFLHLK